MIEYLFVYGTLLDSKELPEAILLNQHIESSEAATVLGELYNAGEYPAAVPHPDKTIHGKLLKINTTKELWEQLDKYEDYKKDDLTNSLFVRSRCDVKTHSDTHSAWVYWFNQDVEGFPMIDSGKWE